MSCRPSSRSSLRTCRLTAGWVRNTRSAAREKPPALTTSTKHCSEKSSTRRSLRADHIISSAHDNHSEVFMVRIVQACHGLGQGGSNMPFIRTKPSEFLVVAERGRLVNRGAAVRLFLRPGTPWVKVRGDQQDACFEMTQETRDGIPLRFKGTVVFRVVAPETGSAALRLHVVDGRRDDAVAAQQGLPRRAARPRFPHDHEGVHRGAQDDADRGRPAGPAGPRRGDGRGLGRHPRRGPGRSSVHRRPGPAPPARGRDPQPDQLRQPAGRDAGA